MSKLFATTLAVAVVNAQSNKKAYMPVTQRLDLFGYGEPKFVGEMLVGESNMSVKIDTTTHNNPVASRTCDYCWENDDTAQGLDLLDSLSAGTANIVRDREDELYYGGNWMDGRYATDQVCIGNECFEDQMVFVVEDEDYDSEPRMSEPYNAVLGLARPLPSWFADTDGPDATDFFLNQNITGYTNGFSLNYRKANASDSEVVFGASDLAGEGA